MKHLGMLAGEASGDILAAAVVAECQQRYPGLELSGIGGPLVSALGLESLYPMDRLSVMGLVEPLARLPELLRIRRHVFAQQVASPPDLFLGVDSPDFNLALERRLRRRGVTTAHLVSPSVWAWRSGRIRTIAEAVDLMLCLLPFELPIYEQAGIPAVCVGHPLVDELAAMPDRDAARTTLGLSSSAPIVAILPGSREGEVGLLMPLFADAMTALHAFDASVQFVIPAANPARRQQIEGELVTRDLPVTVVDGQGRLAMRASNTVLAASGTATLEAMLLERPLVVAYRMPRATWFVLSRLVKTPYIGLPNILAGRQLAPELLQDNAQPEALAKALALTLEHGEESQLPGFAEQAARIGGGFARRSVDALEQLLGNRRCE